MEVNMDKYLSPELMKQVRYVRGAMMEQAEKVLLPSRFVTVPDHKSPVVHFIDCKTGKKARVDLYAYQAARKLLCDLFGEEDEGESV